MDIEYYDRLFSDHFFSQKINAQGMVLEFMDHYYHGIMTGFFPAVSKTEVTFSGNILSDMVCMYYQETVPILQYRTDYKDKKEEDLVQQDYYFRMMKQRMRW